MKVFKRPNSKYWQMKWMVDGKVITRSTRQTDKGKAITMAKAVHAAVKNPDTVEITDGYNPFGMREAPMCLSEAIDRAFSERFYAQADGMGTYTRLRRILAVLGDIPLAEVSSKAITQVKVTLGMDKSNATVNRYMSNLKTVLNMACREWEIIDRVPYIKMFKESPGRIRVFTKAEAKEIYRVLGKSGRPLHKDVAKLVLVALDTGMRLGELVVITWNENIDLDLKQIRLFADQSKGAARTIPLTNRATETLRVALRQGRSGPFTHIRKEYVSRTFKWIKDQLGIDNDPEFLFHACRHTCASRLINHGIEMVTVRDMLGHSSIKVTERYAHTAAKRNLRDAIKVLQ